MTRITTSLAVTVACCMLTSIVRAEGPVPTLPGGVTRQDSDTGNGERWGRVGGRDWTFSNIDSSRFASVEWGPIGPSAVGIAFDGAIDAPGESLTFDPSSSNLAGGQAIWIGATRVDLFNTGSPITTPVDTRFVLTLTSANTNAPLPLAFGSASPGVNVLTGVPFRANLRMEARLTGSTTWTPALDLFDALSTNPIATQLAQTSLQTGFFFVASGGGLTLAEHDANIRQLLSELDGVLDFLRIESVNRLTGIQDSLGPIQSQLQQILNALQASQSGGGGNQSEVLNRIANLQDILMILLGVTPAPPEAAGLKLLQDLASQQSVDGLSTALADVSAAIASCSTQLSVNAVAATLQSVAAQLTNQRAGIDAIASRASQSSVDQLAVGLAAVQAKVDTLKVAAPATSLNVQLVSDVSGKKGRLVALISENGLEVADVIFNAVKVIQTQTNKPTTASAVDFTSSQLGPGLYELAFSLPNGATPTTTFALEVEHVHHGGPSDGASHFGSALIASGAK